MGGEAERKRRTVWSQQLHLHPESQLDLGMFRVQRFVSASMVVTGT